MREINDYKTKILKIEDISNLGQITFSQRLNHNFEIYHSNFFIKKNRFQGGAQ